MSNDEKNAENLSTTWIKQSGEIRGYCGFDSAYTDLFNRNFANFSGSIIEIGPGTGFLAKYIIDNYEVTEYTILDIQRNIDELKESYMKHENYNDIVYVGSGEYEKIFMKDYGLLVATQCLSETPDYYYGDIFSRIQVKNCFIVDEGGGRRHVFNPLFNDSLREWHSKSFTNTDGTHRNFEVKGHAKAGIMTYIGKN